jgi:hypothetical protein
MCELIITKERKAFNLVNDDEKIYRMTIDQKERDYEFLNSPEYHTFYYNPETKMFSNAFCFYVTGKKKLHPENDIHDIWQISFRDMLTRYRKWITDENELSRDYFLPLSNQENSEKMYPVLTDIYLDNAETAWENFVF